MGRLLSRCWPRWKDACRAAAQLVASRWPPIDAAEIRSTQPSAPAQRARQLALVQLQPARFERLQTLGEKRSDDQVLALAFAGSGCRPHRGVASCPTTRTGARA